MYSLDNWTKDPLENSYPIAVKKLSQLVTVGAVSSHRVGGEALKAGVDAGSAANAEEARGTTGVHFGGELAEDGVHGTVGVGHQEDGLAQLRK